ncbi:malate dehydrogenase isoform X3 [Helianthus annuus]|uniref:malate dehydrogenase isoform X3 n=2 Tax=Helianthus annuus TaxID=4232 RepID=UPI000B8EE8ED|nr:malate dehydrogenase isoform X3 [Helianthus annuus]
MLHFETLFSTFSCDFTEFVRRVMRCFSCCFRIRDDNHTQETVDPLASSCVWSVLAHEGYTIVALTKRTQDGGTDVVEAKVGKGSATLSMASLGIYGACMGVGRVVVGHGQLCAMLNI